MSGDCTDNLIKPRDWHVAAHQRLHKNLDELVADFVDQTGRMPSETTVMELIEWSFSQTKNPTEKSSN